MKRILLLALVAVVPALAFADDKPASPYAKWTQGPPTDPNYFPLTVWLQSPRNAEKLKAAGFNTYVGIDGDLTDEEMGKIKGAGMKVICAQTPGNLKRVGDPTIIAWMHGDEPDNAQSLPDGKGYGPPILPQKIIDDYGTIAKTDPTRPVMLNLGLSVAFNDWGGRGTRTGHGEDYAEYIKGADIVSFDIYPVAGSIAQVQGKLEYVAKGVDHLMQIGKGEKVVWNCIETSHIGTKDRIATPKQVRSETWMGIIHGSMGIIYFLHEFTPFKEAAILTNPEMLAGVTALNKQITALAPVLNSPTVANGAEAKSDNSDAPLDLMVKKRDGMTYIFAADSHNAATKATFAVPGLKVGSAITVLDESRTIDVKDTTFSDSFEPYDVHIYQIKD